MISIHAPRAGRDPSVLWLSHPIQISIHAPRAGRDRERIYVRLVAHLFQSTRPVRGATLIIQDAIQGSIFQSTRPVRGATFHAVAHALPLGISIHAPRAGRDWL